MALSLVYSGRAASFPHVASRLMIRSSQAGIGSTSKNRFASAAVSSTEELDGCSQPKITMCPHLALDIRVEAGSGEGHRCLYIAREHILYLLSNCSS